MYKPLSFTLTLDLGIFGEQDVDVSYTYSAGRPAVMYLRNGDPGYPEEPAEIEILSVTCHGVKLPDKMWENDSCVEVIIDELSAFHSEDY